MESILLKDARNQADLRTMAAHDEPLGDDPFEEERNLYQRIINSYRNAVNDINGLLEENIAFLSSFSRVVDTIKEKDNFQEICSVIAESLLQDLGVEYCGVVLFEDCESGEEPLCLEGIREDQRFIHIHSGQELLGSRDFHQAVTVLVREAAACLNIPDVYRESRFNGVDFSSVVRSLVVLPILLRGVPVGALLASHSLPRYFSENHLRLLRILSGILTQSRFLTGRHAAVRNACGTDAVPGQAAARQDVVSVVLMSFDLQAVSGRPATPNKDAILGIRRRLSEELGSGELLLLYGDNELLLLLPGTSPDQMAMRAGRMQEAFQEWRASQNDRLRATRMSLGYSACEGTEDIARTLEVTSLMMHPDQDR